VVAGLDEVAVLVARERARRGRSPYLVAMTGGVAAGKSTLAAALAERLTPARVEVVTTDGFLHPNAVLAARGLTERKGFPESYDRERLVSFLGALSASETEVRAPVYSHLRYDVTPGEQVVVRSPDVLLVEGLNVLQPPRARSDGRSSLAVSDFFDVSVYVDASSWDIQRWYVARFLRLRETAFADPASYFHRYAALTDDAATRRRRPRPTSGVRSTSPTSCRTSCRPAAARPWCYRKARTMPYAGSGCASSDALTMRSGSTVD